MIEKKVAWVCLPAPFQSLGRHQTATVTTTVHYGLLPVHYGSEHDVYDLFPRLQYGSVAASAQSFALVSTSGNIPSFSYACTRVGHYQSVPTLM